MEPFLGEVDDESALLRVRLILVVFSKGMLRSSTLFGLEEL